MNFICVEQTDGKLTMLNADMIVGVDETEYGCRIFSGTGELIETKLKEPFHLIRELLEKKNDTHNNR